MRILVTIATALFIAAVPLIFVGNAVRFLFSYQPLYEWGFDSFGVARYTGIERTDLSRVAGALIAYFNNDDREVNLTITQQGVRKPVFTPKEVNHMVDVKAIVRTVGTIGNVSLVYVVAFAGVALWRGGRGAASRIGNATMVGSIATVLLVAGLGVLSFLDFESLFLQFHQVVFTANSDWLLDPRIHNLIAMFPEPFWFWSTLFLGAAIVIQAIAGIVLGWQIRKSGREAMVPVARTAPTSPSL